jgi:gliding motility-associated-like protein
MRLSMMLCVSFTCISHVIMGQQPIWGKVFASHGGSYVKAMAFAPQRDIYAAGRFVQDLIIDGRVLRSPENFGDGFLLRIDSLGGVKWARSIGATIDSGIADITSDNTGNLFVLGVFDGELFLPNDTLRAAGADTLSYFFCKYDKDGTEQWGHVFQNTLIYDITIDDVGNTYLVAVNFPSETTATLEFRLLKFSNNGELINSKLVGSADPLQGFMTIQNISLDKDGNIVLLGEAHSSIIIEGTTYNSSGVADPILLKYTPQMNLVWVRLLDEDYQTGPRSHNKLLTDGMNNIYYVGLLLDNSIVTKFDSSGNIFWKLIPDYNGDYNTKNYHFFSTSAFMDEEGDLILAGVLYGHLRINGTPIFQPVNQLETGVVIKCTKEGDVVWSLTGGGPLLDQIMAATRDPLNGHIYFGGDLSPGLSKYGSVELIVDTDKQSAFVVKLSDNDFQSLLNPLGIDTTLCTGEQFVVNTKKFSSYLWQDGSTDSILNVSKPGEYLLTATDYLGNVYNDTIRIAPCFESTMPNVITPNGDPMNEYLVFEQMDISKSNVLTIYDRWGKQVYQSINYQNDWNGEGLPRGIYFYILFNAYDRKKYKGWVQVME